jgi:hypothetical protein
MRATYACQFGLKPNIFPTQSPGLKAGATLVSFALCRDAKSCVSTTHIHALFIKNPRPTFAILKTIHVLRASASLVLVCNEDTPVVRLQHTIPSTSRSKKRYPQFSNTPKTPTILDFAIFSASKCW